MHSLWTRLALAVSITAALLMPWLLLRLALGVYFLGDVDSGYAPAERLAVRVYVGYLGAELALAVLLAFAAWWTGRRVGRGGGRPTGRDMAVLTAT